MKENLTKYKKYFDTMFKKIDSNIVLDENQRKVILTDKCHLLVVAGAGSGKTTTMSAKVKFLIEKRNVDPKKIMVISFTNKASDEIAHRIHHDFGFKGVNVCTFHKLGMKILRANKEKILIIDDEEKNKIFDIFMNELFKNKRKLKEYIHVFDELKFDKSCLKYQNLYEYHSDYCLKNDLDEELTSAYLYYKDFINKVCVPFIQTFKGNGYSLHFFNTLNCTKITKKKLLLLKEVYLFYEKYLNKHNLVDFEDMISLATSKLSKNNDTFSFKYMIIDEYQDISMQRYLFIQKFVELFDTKIMAVGDDFQSIFSFAGARIDLFTDFKKKFKGAKIIPIVNTYRNSMELVDVASHFVLKNKYQINKRLKSIKRLENPIELYYFDDEKKEDLSKSLLVSHIIHEIYTKTPNHDILLLGRYKEDVNSLLKSSFFKIESGKLICTTCPKANITFLTVHSSKGLGFDDCILINASNKAYGFPSLIKDEDVFKILKNEMNEGILYPEERRLFYVALTRTKNKFYIAVPKNKPSIFINEIKNERGVLSHKKIFVYEEKIASKYICPNCKNKLWMKTIDEKIKYYECEHCFFKTTNLKKKTPIFNCPKCNSFVIYKYRNANGFDIYKCLNKNCLYQKKVYKSQLLEKIILLIKKYK